MGGADVAESREFGGCLKLTRQYVVDLLRKAGLRDLAGEARRVLPDPVDQEQVSDWAAARGLYWDEIQSRMGGSP